MTHWIELEREKNLSSLKTVAFASTAHEFRNPLNGIISALMMLKPLVILDTREHKFY
jgi:signal transduction histidine kinase